MKVIGNVDTWVVDMGELKSDWVMSWSGLGCYNKNINWVAHTTNINSLSSENWEVQDKGISRSGVWGKPSSWFAHGHLFVSSHGRGQREETSSLVSFLIRALIPT